MWQRIGSLIVKELLAICRDPQGPLILIVPPMFQMLVFSVRRHAGGEERADGGAERGLRNRRARPGRRGSRARPISPRSAISRGEADIAPAIDSRSVLMVLHIGPDFSRRLDGRNAGRGATDPRRPPLQRGPDRRRLCQAIVDRFNRELAATRPHVRRRRASSPRGSGSTPTWKPPGTPCPAWSPSSPR